MRGEHFLMLAEREQLLAPVVLTQLRRILAQQRRPATGEAVARLLVDRSYLTGEQARRLIQLGNGAGSPLVPQMAIATPPVERSAPQGADQHQSDELLLAPVESKKETRPVAQAPTSIAARWAEPKSVPAAAAPPVIPTAKDLAELTNSLQQWMDTPGTLDWNAAPSPLFAPPRWQMTPAMLLLGAGGILVLIVLGMLVVLTGRSAG